MWVYTNIEIKYCYFHERCFLLDALMPNHLSKRATCYKVHIESAKYLFFFIIVNCKSITLLLGPPNTIFFFFENTLKKKLLNIFSNFFFYLKIQSFQIIMENNFIQMAASAGHAVAYTIGPIFKHIIDCVQLYFKLCSFTNIVL